MIDRYMAVALAEAKEGWKREGGVPIGAVLVEKDRIISRGRNQRVQKGDQLIHAEIDCLRNARLTGGYHGMTLYTTLMPCYMCAGTLYQFGIKKVVAGESVSAPHAREFLDSHEIEVIDLDNDECKTLLQEYIHENPEKWAYFLSECNPEEGRHNRS